MSIRLGETFPDFSAETNASFIRSFHDWIGNRLVIALMHLQTKLISVGPFSSHILLILRLFVQPNWLVLPNLHPNLLNEM
jgi:hypothetical protein